MIFHIGTYVLNNTTYCCYGNTISNIGIVNSKDRTYVIYVCICTPNS